MTRRPAGRSEQRRRSREAAPVDDVEEQLEQAAVRGAEDRGDRDQPVGGDDGIDGRLELWRREARQEMADQILSVLPKLDDSDGWLHAGVTKVPVGRSGQPIGEKAR